MKHVMLDLETMSTQSNAVITSIGACLFDANGVSAKFYRSIGDWNDQVKHGAHLSGSTIMWWMGSETSSPNEDARRAMLRDQYKPAVALLDFCEFLDGLPDVCVWGNGADFDNIILGGMFDAYKIKKPWSYSRNRCFRTIKNLVFPKTIVLPAWAGTAHNALDDAVYQAEYLIAIDKAFNGVIL